MNYLPYDALNGSLVEQDLLHVIGNEEAPCKAIKRMATGDFRPQEIQATIEENPQVAAASKSANAAPAAVPHI
jgi:hypothetical protein